MHSKRKRGVDHYWTFYRYEGDAAYYARCRCGFEYGCYKTSELNVFPVIPAPEKLYKYCPNCGARKTKYYIELIIQKDEV